MRTRSVRWHDGMMILPHHFQAQYAHLLDLIDSTMDWRNQCSYGLAGLRYVEESLKNWKVEITHLKARFKNGTCVTVPVSARLPEIDTQKVFDTQDAIRVDTQDAFRDSDGNPVLKLAYIYILLPRIVQGRSNSAAPGRDVEQNQRFKGVEYEFDEINTGQNRRHVELNQLNLQLRALPSQDVPAGYDALPIMRLRLSTKEGAVPELDHTYIPPLLACDCFPPMQEDMVSAMYSLVGAYLKKQAARLRARGDWSGCNSPDVARLLAQLQAVNSSYPVLFQQAKLHGQHPYNVYLELTRLIGQLSIFLPELEALELPVYDHERLGDVFSEVKKRLVDIFRMDEFGGRVVRRPFAVTADDLLEICLEESDWLDGQHDFYIGIKSDLSPDTLQRLFASSHLDWKLGASRQIADIYQQGEAGVEVRLDSDRDNILPSLTDMAYFRIRTKGMYWDSVKEAPTLAIKINTRFIHKARRATNVVEVKDEDDRVHVLNFDLFVVQEPEEPESEQ